MIAAHGSVDSVGGFVFYSNIFSAEVIVKYYFGVSILIGYFKNFGSGAFKIGIKYGEESGLGMDQVTNEYIINLRSKPIIKFDKIRVGLLRLLILLVTDTAGFIDSIGY